MLQFSMKQPHCGVGVLVRRRIGKGGSVGSHYGSLFYSALGVAMRSVSKDCCGEDIFKVVVLEFLKWTNERSLEQTVGREIHRFYIVYASFCVMQFVNPHIYPPKSIQYGNRMPKSGDRKCFLQKAAAGDYPTPQYTVMNRHRNSETPFCSACVRPVTLHGAARCTWNTGKVDLLK